MKVRLLIPAEVLDPETNQTVLRQPGYVVEGPDSYKLCGCYEMRPYSPYYKMRVAEPADIQAQAMAQPYYAKALSRLQAEHEQALAELEDLKAQIPPEEDEDDDDD